MNQPVSSPPDKNMTIVSVVPINHVTVDNFVSVPLEIILV